MKTVVSRCSNAQVSKDKKSKPQATCEKDANRNVKMLILVFYIYTSI